MSKFWHVHFPQILLGVLLLALFAMLASCTTKKQLLSEIRAINTRLSIIDSTYNHTQIKIYNYEKSRIDSTYKNITDDDLLRRIDALTKPNPKGRN